MGGGSEFAGIYDDANPFRVIPGQLIEQHRSTIADPAALRNATHGICANDDFIIAGDRRSAHPGGESYRHPEVRPDAGAARRGSFGLPGLGERSNGLRSDSIWRGSRTVRLHCAPSAVRT